jgi:hypothetical protein
MPRPLLACVPMFLTCTATLADNCESISAQIDSKIRATGVSNFTLTTVDAGAAASGQVVGTCGMGSRKIIYSGVGASAPKLASSGSSPASALRARKPAGASDIITECKDGSMSLGGDCKN